MHKAVLSIFISENKVFIVGISRCVECLRQDIKNKIVAWLKHSYILPSCGHLYKLQQKGTNTYVRVLIIPPKITVVRADGLRHSFRLYYQCFTPSGHFRPHIPIIQFLKS